MTEENRLSMKTIETNKIEVINLQSNQNKNDQFLPRNSMNGTGIQTISLIAIPLILKCTQITDRINKTQSNVIT